MTQLGHVSNSAEFHCFQWPRCTLAFLDGEMSSWGKAKALEEQTQLSSRSAWQGLLGTFPLDHWHSLALGVWLPVQAKSQAFRTQSKGAHAEQRDTYNHHGQYADTSSHGPPVTPHLVVPEAPLLSWIISEWWYVFSLPSRAEQSLLIPSNHAQG